MTRKNVVISILSILLLIGIHFLGTGNCSASSRVMVFAAASTTNALGEIANLFKRSTGIDVECSFASSSTLAKQIEQGAPASILISADEDWMNYLANKNIVDTKSQVALLGNTLVLIAPVQNKLNKIDNFKTGLITALGNGRMATGDPDHVPVGKYAKAALQKLGVWKDIEPRLARASDVRGALALVERGEAPLGIVYSTDATITMKVKVIGTFPSETYPPIVYPAALVTGNDTDDARKFFEFLKGAQAKAIFEKYGFKVK
ncbi:MAG: molybdate ABC transporter substrate-binding protein [Desulfomonilaceae bacterium]